MSLANESNGMVMPVSPMYGSGGSGGFGFGNDGGLFWLLVLFPFGFAGNGWGNGFGGGGNTQNEIQRGFDQQSVMTGLNGIQNGITGISTQLCNSFANVETAANARQVADMQQSFANQTAMNQGFNNLQSQFANCCCENRLATCQTQNIVQNEGAATRAAIQEQTQAILDKMCQQEIDALKTANNNLQTQVLMRDLAASQNAQTAALVADNTAQTQYIVNRVAPYPTPAYVVQNPNGCGNNACGCGCGTL